LIYDFEELTVVMSEMKMYAKITIGKPEGNNLFGRLRRVLRKNKINVGFKDMGCDAVDWVVLVL
jgi:hypothetical protein